VDLIPLLQEIKNKVLHRWGILDLLDVLIEADRYVDFSRFFYSTGQRQVLGQKEVKERLLLCLFGIATNLGLKRIHAATQPDCTYDDLLYFRKRFVNVDPVRSAIAALTNRILELRNPAVWGNTTTCASDGKYIGSWDQNLVAEWNPHYKKTRVMAYWHVDTNSTCVYSQLNAPMSSQVAAMIKGLVLHDTEMRIESNFVDSHGQSEVAFPFCRFIGVELCPRLKRMKYERLYLPGKGMESHFKNLKGVLSRPIRWQKVQEQYGEMARHVAAVLERTGPIESILRRFNSYNRNHPTYKAFIESGKALKTIHSCKYLTRPPYRTEINEGLNIVENWNSSNSFISYGRKSEIQTNDPELQELSILCLHLLQNALILVNTIMVERVLHEEGMLHRMQPEDLNALTPLFTLNINPYGYFSLDFEKPSVLEAA
jgi:TnpA family transposase